MDNQVRAAVVNSTNRDDWDTIREQFENDEIGLVLISEQRLANPAFRQDWLPQVGARVGQVNAWRREEQAAMETYQQIDTCRMQYLRRQLDDADPEPCGVCDNCRGVRFGVDAAVAVVAEAGDRLRHDHVEIAPRLMWPTGFAEAKGRIPAG